MDEAILNSRGNSSEITLREDIWMLARAQWLECQSSSRYNTLIVPILSCSHGQAVVSGEELCLWGL